MAENMFADCKTLEELKEYYQFMKMYYSNYTEPKRRIAYRDYRVRKKEIENDSSRTN